MTPPDMTELETWWKSGNEDYRVIEGIVNNIIAARDKQWAEMRDADEALMREALEMCEAVLCNYVCRGTHEETVKHNAAIDAVRARLGGV